MFKLCFFEMRLHFSTLPITFGLFFLYIIVTPLLIGFSTELLYHFNLGVIWLCILFAFLPERWFQSDWEDGTLELYLLSRYPLSTILTAKLSGYWIIKLSGILSSFPFLAFLYHFESSQNNIITMILGSLAFTLVCAVHSSLTLGLKSTSWSNIQQLTTLPTLLPLILLLSQAKDTTNTILLVGYLGILSILYLTVVSTTLRSIASQ